MRKRIWIIILAIFMTAGWTFESRAEVVIKVRALNPLNTKETAVINYPLPKKVTKDDIIKQKITYSLDHTEEEEPPKSSFQISYNESKEEYYVDDEVVLLPKEVVTLEVHVNDVWIIERSQIEDLKVEVDELIANWKEQMETENTIEEEEREGEEQQREAAEELDDKTRKKEETLEFALVMKEEIIKGIDGIITRQDQNKIITVGVERHIAAYEDNIEDLRQVQQDIVLLANLIQFEIEDEDSQEPEDGQSPEEQEQDSEVVADIAQDEVDEAAEDGEGLSIEEQKI